MNDYQLYCLTHPTDDPAELNKRFWNQSQAIYDKLNQQRAQEQMKQEIIDEVLKQIRIEIKNEASPTVEGIKNDIDKLFSK